MRLLLGDNFLCIIPYFRKKSKHIFIYLPKEYKVCFFEVILLDLLTLK